MTRSSGDGETTRLVVLVQDDPDGKLQGAALAEHHDLTPALEKLASPDAPINASVRQQAGTRKCHRLDPRRRLGDGWGLLRE